MATPSDKGNKKEQQTHAQETGKSTSMTPTKYRSGGMTPYSGWEPFRRMRDEFDRLFDRFFQGWPVATSNMSQDWSWGLDVKENDNDLLVRAEAPGFEPSDFDLQVRDNHLVLHASHKAETEEKERGFHEWRQQEFYREVPLPSGIDANKVEAKYRNGVLTVTMPKTGESKARRITVQG